MSNQMTLTLMIVVAIGVYIAIIALLPKRFSNRSSQHLKSAMQRLREQNQINASALERNDGVLGKNLEDNIFVKAYSSLPFVSEELGFIERAGLMPYFDRVVMVGLALMIGLFIITSKYGMLSLIIAPSVTLFAMYMFISMRAKKRRKHFLDLFPDALDIIVRSVKAGYPINNSIAMVADSMPPEIGKEYTRIVNEASYGYTLTEAVERFAERVDQPDVNFFSVVVGVQQETGGNLSEILSNLSALIRQRKHLRLKVLALSAEGRMTVWVLVGIAFFMVLIVHLFQPTHFKPLLETSAGHTVMMSIGGIFICTFFIIRKIINFKI